MFYNIRRYWIILFSKFQLTVVASNHIYHLSPILALSDGLRNKRKHFMIIFWKSSLVLLDLKSLGAQNMTFSLLNKKTQKTYPPNVPILYSLLCQFLYLAYIWYGFCPFYFIYCYLSPCNAFWLQILHVSLVRYL